MSATIYSKFATKLTPGERYRVVYADHRNKEFAFVGVYAGMGFRGMQFSCRPVAGDVYLNEHSIVRADPSDLKSTVPTPC